MIQLSSEQNKMIENIHDGIKIKRDKVMLSYPGQPKMVIPSKMYPLKYKKTIQLFHPETNIGPIEDELAIQIFDKLEFKVGHCYQNTEKIVNAFTWAGLGEDIKPMTGWLFSGPVPIHHCWAVYKENYVIDPGVDISQLAFKERLSKVTHVATKDEMRKMLIEEFKKLEDEPNHKTKAFGEVFPYNMYIGSYTTPKEGIDIFNALMKEYPNHPSYSSEGMNGQGVSRTQQLMNESGGL